MVTALALLVLVSAAEAPLGPVLRGDGFQLRPPYGFRPARMDLFHGTRAGVVALRGSSSGLLSVALTDGDQEDASSMLIGVVDEPFSVGPSARDELSTAVMRHFRDELGQPFALERAEVKNGRVEVLGSIRQGSQLRRVVVAWFPGELRHVVVTASASSGRWDSLRPLLDQSLDSLRPDAMPAGPPQRLVWAVAAVLGALLMASIGLWSRRRSARSSGAPGE